MLSIFSVKKSKLGNKYVGKTTLAPGQFLTRATTWNDQIKICIDHGEMGTALDVFRLQIAEANRVGTAVTKWGDMKAADLAKEQGEHTIKKLTDVPDVWNYQGRLYGDCEGMSIVRDTVQLVLSVEDGVQPSRAAIERGERAMPDTDVSERELKI